MLEVGCGVGAKGCVEEVTQLNCEHRCLPLHTTLIQVFKDSPEHSLVIQHFLWNVFKIWPRIFVSPFYRQFYASYEKKGGSTCGGTAFSVPWRGMLSEVPSGLRSHRLQGSPGRSHPWRQEGISLFIERLDYLTFKNQLMILEIQLMGGGEG